MRPSASAFYAPVQRHVPGLWHLYVCQLPNTQLRVLPHTHSPLRVTACPGTAPPALPVLPSCLQSHASHLVRGHEPGQDRISRTGSEKAGQGVRKQDDERHRETQRDSADPTTDAGKVCKHTQSTPTPTNTHTPSTLKLQTPPDSMGEMALGRPSRGPARLT
jgi:hypothetical protein